MALADLLALARAGVAGTHGTREQSGTRSIPNAVENKQFQTLPTAGTPGTPGTRRNIDADTVPPPSIADLAERLARAESCLPWQRVTSPAGLDYLRANARVRLAGLDREAWSRAVLDAEARAHAMAVHSRGTGR